MRKILLGALVLLAGCTAVPGTPDATSAPVAATPAPAPPPAACLLDPAALATATGLGWRADPVTASDTRCVYDPDGGGAFLVVDLTPGTDVETPAALCDADTRIDLTSGGWTCRFGDGVFGAGVRGDTTVTIAAATVPAGTDLTRFTAAIAVQLDRLAAS